MAIKREGPPAPAADLHAAERALARKLSRVGDDLAREEEATERRASSAETRYAKSGDLSIAYQAVGSGRDVVFVAGSVSHVELGWEDPPQAPVHRRLSRFGRLITFDKRGVGLSDRTAELPTLEQRMDDLRAVMDAADCERAAVVGMSEGGPTALLFAALYPERVSALVLWATFARLAWAPDYRQGIDVEEAEEFMDQIEESWGHGRVGPLLSTQDAPENEATRRRAARFERSSATPAMAAAANRFSLYIDARHALSSISAPTLVIHRTGDPLINVVHGRYLAEHIRGARFSEFPGDFHESAMGKDEEVLDEIEEFLTGTRQEHEIDRVLKTIMFTDIVGSTERAVSMGDHRWHDLLDAHDSAVRGQLERFHGQEVKTIGDGFLAAFDGPARAIRCAQAITGEAEDMGLEVRAGLHTGECEARGDDLAGIAVHIGARVGNLAGPNEVIVTSTVRDLVTGSGLEFHDRGMHELKGIPGEWQVLAVAPDSRRA
ncbi:MAG TPA: adenylate/guanylate cyclase domain-containing protein [Solirubrobacterales bacterium]|jgi:pimeloyl-ACP methyl ester carboxylesterase